MSVNRQDLPRPRGKRGRAVKSSLAPLFWVLGIFGGLAIVGGIVLIVLLNQDDNPATANGPGGQAKQPGGAPPAAPPPPPAAAQVTVLPQVRGRDPLSLTAALQTVLTELDRIDPGWRLADIEARRSAFPPEKNGALVIRTAAHYLPPGWVSLPGDGLSHSPMPPQRPHTAAQIAATRNALARVPAALAEAHKLKSVPGGRFRLEYRPDYLSTPVTDSIQPTINVTRLLISDALLRAEDGDAEGALESCRAALNATHTLAEDPLTISQLARMALCSVTLNALERALTLKKGAAPQTLLAMQQLLEQEGAWPVLTVIYRGERAGYHFLLSNVANGDATLPNAPGVRISGDDHAAYLRHLSRVVAATAEPPPPDINFEQLNTDAVGLPMRVRAMVPSIFKVNAPCQATMARLRSAAVALAVERYRLQNGRWPETLNALVPTYLRTVPVDPYHGQPYRYASRPEGVAVYCLPGDVVDQRGDFERMNQPPPMNQGFRLLNPNLRR